MSSMGELSGGVLSKGWSPFFWLSVLSKNVVSQFGKGEGFHPRSLLLYPLRVDISSGGIEEVGVDGQRGLPDIDDEEFVSSLGCFTINVLVLRTCRIIIQLRRALAMERFTAFSVKNAIQTFEGLFVALSRAVEVRPGYFLVNGHAELKDAVPGCCLLYFELSPVLL